MKLIGKTFEVGVFSRGVPTNQVLFTSCIDICLSCLQVHVVVCLQVHVVVCLQAHVVICLQVHVVICLHVFTTSFKFMYQFGRHVRK